MSCLPNYRTRADELLTEYRVAKAQWREDRDALVLAEDTATDAEEALRVCQIVAQAVQQKAHDRIAGIVSRCLEAVFDEPYEFKILFEQKRGKTEASLVFERDGLQVDPLTASGGGVVDVAAFALRLSCLMLSRPTLRRLLVLDEPFKFVSEQYRERVRVMLETLSKDLGVQIVMVTHIEELKMGKVIEL